MSKSSAIRAGRAYVELFVKEGKVSEGLRKAQAKLKQFGSEVQRIGQGLFLGGAAGALPFGLSAKAFGEFEQRMAVVEAVTGATKAEFAALVAEAEHLGKTTVFTATQAADAMAYFGRAGFDAKSILEATRPALDLAAAGQLEVGEAANIATQVLKQFQLDASETGRVMDVLTKAMTSANTTLPQLGDAFKYVGTLSNIAGAEVEEVAAAIQVLSDAGIQGELAGTSLRGVLATIASPSKEAQKAIDDLGVKFSDADGNMLSFVEIFGQFEAALSGMTDAQQLGILAKIFPNRQVAAVAGSIARGSQELHNLTEALYEAGGTAAEIAAVQLNTLEGQMTLATSAANGLAITVGKQLAPYLRMVLEAGTRGIRVLESWVSENRKVVLVTAAVTASVLITGAALIGLGIAMKVTAFGIGTVVSVLGLLKLSLTAVLFLVGAITSPLALAAAGFAALGVAVVNWSGAGGRALNWLKTQFRDLFEGAGPVIEGIQDALMAKNIPLAADILFKGLEIAWMKGVEALRSIWSDFLIWMNTSMIKATALAATIMEMAKGGAKKIQNWVNDSAENALWSLIDSWDAHGGGGTGGERTRPWRENRAAERDARDTALANEVYDKLREIEEKRREQLSNLGLDPETSKKLQEATDEMKKLKDELAALLAEAAQAREEERKRREQEASIIDPASLLAQGMLGGPGASARGTFSGSSAALGSLGSQNGPLVRPVVEIAKQVKKIERNTKQQDYQSFT